ARDLVQAGAALAILGDPRPGVCNLPPAMVHIKSGELVLGVSPDQEEEWVQVYISDYPAVDKDALRTYLRALINDQAATIPPFELARYPVTNAQYKLIVEAGGYDLTAPWWDEAAHVWLARDDTATEGLESWQRLQHKDRPEWWDHGDLGIARPNYPVV